MISGPEIFFPGVQGIYRGFGETVPFEVLSGRKRDKVTEIADTKIKITEIKDKKRQDKKIIYTKIDESVHLS